MKQKYFVLILFACLTAFPQAGLCETELGINAGTFLPFADFGNITDSGYCIGSHLRNQVYENSAWGVSLNYGTTKGDHGADYWGIDIYPFLDWFFYRSDKIDMFGRAGIGISHWESKKIWWLDDKDTSVIVSFGIGCVFMDNVELLATVNNIYADFDIQYFTVSLGYNFDITK